MSSELPSTSLASISIPKAPSFSDFAFKTIGKSTRAPSVPSLLKRLSTTHMDPHVEGDDTEFQGSSPLDDPEADIVVDSPINNKALNAVNDQLRARHSRLDNLISSLTSHENSLQVLSQHTSSAISLSQAARDLSAQGLALLEQSQVTFKSASKNAERAIESAQFAHNNLRPIIEQQEKQDALVIEVRKELCLLAELINAHNTHEERYIRECQQRELKKELERERRKAEEERQLREKMADYEAALAQIKAQLASKSRDRDLHASPGNVQSHPITSTSGQIAGTVESVTTQAKTLDFQTSAAPSVPSPRSQHEATERPARDSHSSREQEDLAKKRQQETEAAELKKRELQLRLEQERRQAERMILDQETPLRPTPASSTAPSPSDASVPPVNHSQNGAIHPPSATTSAKKKKAKKKNEPVVKKEPWTPLQQLSPINCSVNPQSYQNNESTRSSSIGGSASPVDRLNQHIGRAGGDLLPPKPEVKEENSARLLASASVLVSQAGAQFTPLASSSQTQIQRPLPSTVPATNHAEQSQSGISYLAPPIAKNPQVPISAERPLAPPVIEGANVSAFTPLRAEQPIVSAFPPRTTNSTEMRSPATSLPIVQTTRPAPSASQPLPVIDRTLVDSAQFPSALARPQQEKAGAKQYASSHQEPNQSRRPIPANEARQLWRDASPMGPEDSARAVGSRYVAPPQASRSNDHWSPSPPGMRKPPSRAPSPPPPRSFLKRSRNDIEPQLDYPSHRQPPPPNRSFLDRLDVPPSYDADLQYPRPRSPLTPPRYSSPVHDERSGYRDDNGSSRPTFLERLNVPPSAKERERDSYRPPPSRAPVSPRGRRPHRGRGGKAPLASRITTSSLQDRLSTYA